MPKTNDAQDNASSNRPLAALAKQLGKPDPALLAAHLAGTSDAKLVEVGRSISSARIVTDTSRIYHQAWEFWQGASAAQKRCLRGFSPALLALAVHQALALEALDAAHADNTKAAAAARDKTDRAAEAIFTTALALRDQAASSLGDAAGHDEELNADVESAKGTAGDGDELADGLAGLAKLLRGWLKKGKTDKTLQGRLTLAALDAGYADELDEASTKVRDAAAAAKRRPAGGRVTQGELDRADGVNVLLLGQIIRAFDAAHDRDPTIPRLVPIATRRLFVRKAKKQAGAEKGDEEKTEAKKADGEKAGAKKADGEKAAAEKPDKEKTAEKTPAQGKADGTVAQPKDA